MTEYKNSAYVQHRDAVEIQGARTTFQVSQLYDTSMALPADMVMVYRPVDRGWAGQDYIMAAMQPMNKIPLDYYEQHPEDRQMQSDGTNIHGGDIKASPNGYQSQAFIDYKKEIISQAVNNFDPQMFIFEEPEYYRRGLYNDRFKQLWKEHYGTDWVDPLSSTDAVMASQRLTIALECNAIAQLSDHYKTLAPNGLFGIAAHSHFNYRAHGIVAGIYGMAATGKVDVIIGQAWSDTIKHFFLYNGTRVQRPFLLGYLEYGTYIDAATKNGAQLFALIDPMSDEKQRHTEEELRALNRHQVVSSLMHAEVHRWENCIWPDRAFRDASDEYKTELLSIYNALNDISGKQYTLTAGTPGVTYLLSDTLNWQVTDNGWCNDPSQSYYGVAMPLIDDGIPLKVGSMEYVTSANDLAEVSLLLVSYDSMKPQSEQVNKAIADWVKAGGTLLYIGGHDAYESAPDQWWAGAEGRTPYGNLLHHLGLSSVEVGAAGENKDRACYRGQGFTPLFTSPEDDILAMEAAVGEGHFLSVGLPSYYFAATEGGADWIKSLCAYAMQYTDYDYAVSPVFQVERGRYTALHALHEDHTLAGTYLDIFDSTLPIVTDPVVKAGESALYYRVDTALSGLPSVTYLGGRLQGELIQTTERTAFSICGPTRSTSSVRLQGNGKHPKSVTVIRPDVPRGESAVTTWDDQTGSLLVQIAHDSVKPYTVEVQWEALG